ncbi:MAG: hypothetical protein U0998_06005 [Moraxellaceae bacterium]|nr:hypothetical protein [Moraxellaceae bacterium]MDZ4386760.1 hypothetical protein [Moraxellaceae bacterium]
MKSERLISLLNWVGLPLVAIYAICMFVAPWYEGNGSWAYVQNVWERWQGLNVGVLAFVSSITAFNISRFNANKQREREFAASKAFLPSALSELVTYFIESAAVFKLGWSARHGERPNFVSPSLPNGYKEVFRDCIRHAEPEVGEFLALILMRMQVHDARLRGYIGEDNSEGSFSPQRHNLISYFYRIAELQALVGKLFEYARGLEPFDPSALKWEDFRNAYGNLNIWQDQYKFGEHENLEEFTKCEIARNSSQDT